MLGITSVFWEFPSRSMLSLLIILFGHAMHGLLKCALHFPLYYHVFVLIILSFAGTALPGSWIWWRVMCHWSHLAMSRSSDDLWSSGLRYEVWRCYQHTIGKDDGWSWASYSAWESGTFQKPLSTLANYGGCRTLFQQTSFPNSWHFFVCLHTAKWQQSFLSSTPFSNHFLINV